MTHFKRIIAIQKELKTIKHYEVRKIKRLMIEMKIIKNEINKELNEKHFKLRLVK